MTDFTEFLAWLLVFVIGCVVSFVFGVWVGTDKRYLDVKTFTGDQGLEP